MKIKTKIRAGHLIANHNGVKVKTKIRAGHAPLVNHNCVKL